MVRRLWTVLVLVGLVLAGACSGTDNASPGSDVADGLRIASFDFAESTLLAELYAQLIEGADVPVVRLGAVGPREIVAPALQLDRMDLIPEYLGTATRFFAEPNADVDVLASRSELARLLAPRGLVPLEPSGAEDANAIVVTRTFAADSGLEAIGDLVPGASEMRFGGPVECPERPLCLAGLRDVYGIEFGGFEPQRSLKLTAEALRRGEVEVGLMFTTAAELDVAEFSVLEDDKGLQPPENVVPVIREDALERWPESGEALNRLSAELTTADLREMNRLVAAGSSVAEVSSEWLMDKGLVDG